MATFLTSTVPRKNSFTGNSVLVFVAQVFRYVLMVAAWAIVARALGPAALGRLQLEFVFCSWVVLFTELGLSIGTIYYVGKKFYPVEDVLGYVLFRAVIASAASVTALWIASPLVLRYVKVPADLYVWVLVWIPLQILTYYLGALFTAEQRFGQLYVVTFLQGVAVILVIAPLTLLLKLGDRGALAGIMAGTLVAATVEFAILVGKFHWRNLSIRRNMNRDFLRFGIRGYFANIAQLFTYRFDSFIVGYDAGSAALGIYAVAYTAAELLWYIPSTVATVLMTTTAGSSAEEASVRTARVCRMALLFAGTAGIAGGLVASPVFPLLGARYAASITLLWALLPGTILLAAAKILSADFIGRGRPEYSSHSSGVGFVATVVLDLLLIPRYGALAAAVISSLIYGLQTLYLFRCFRFESGLPYRQFVLAEKSDLALLLRAVSRETTRLRLFPLAANRAKASIETL